MLRKEAAAALAAHLPPGSWELVEHSEWVGVGGDGYKGPAGRKQPVAAAGRARSLPPGGGRLWN